MQDLKSIRVFLEVSKLQSFVAAAKSLKMTPATVTRIIARLEEDLGHQLLLRTTRQVSLTSAGALIAARYSPLVEAFDRVEQDLEREMHPYRGSLSINAPMSFGVRLMPQLLESFRLAYPHVDLNIRLTDRLVDILAEDCDLSIRVSGIPTDKSTIWRKLAEVPMIAVASPKLFEKHALPASPEELDPRLCLSYGEEAKPETWRFEKGPQKRAITAGTAVQSNNGDLLYELACNGMGIVVLPQFHVADGLKSGEVIRVLDDWALPSLWLSLFYPPYEALPPLVATFTDFFEAFLADVDGLDP